jgi:hypothetical protein
LPAGDAGAAHSGDPTCSCRDAARPHEARCAHGGSVRHDGAGRMFSRIFLGGPLPSQPWLTIQHVGEYEEEEVERGRGKSGRGDHEIAEGGLMAGRLRHSWVKLKPHVYICRRCGSGRVNAQQSSGEWFTTWHRSNGESVVDVHVPPCEVGRETTRRLERYASALACAEPSRRRGSAETTATCDRCGDQGPAGERCVDCGCSTYAAEPSTMIEEHGASDPSPTEPRLNRCEGSRTVAQGHLEVTA